MNNVPRPGKNLSIRSTTIISDFEIYLQNQLLNETSCFGNDHYLIKLLPLIRNPAQLKGTQYDKKQQMTGTGSSTSQLFASIGFVILEC